MSSESNCLGRFRSTLLLHSPKLAHRTRFARFRPNVGPTTTADHCLAGKQDLQSGSPATPSSQGQRQTHLPSTDQTQVDYVRPLFRTALHGTSPAILRSELDQLRPISDLGRRFGPVLAESAPASSRKGDEPLCSMHLGHPPERMQRNRLTGVSVAALGS